MCSNDEYNYHPSITVGGPPGTYKVNPPVLSMQYAEFCVVAVSCRAAGPTMMLVSGSDNQAALDVTGNTTYNDNSSVRGAFYVAGTNSTTTPQEIWERIANSQGNVFVTITGGTSAFITIKFRERIIKRIQGPLKAMPQDMVVRGDYNQIHHEREKRIQESVFGEAGEQETLDKRVVNLGRIKR